MSDKQLLNSFLAGSLSGSVSTILFQPFDLVKTRLQNNVTSTGTLTSSSALTRNPASMSSVIIDVVRSDSLPGLWKGTSAALIRTVPGVGLYFMTLDVLKNNFSSSSKSPSHSCHHRLRHNHSHSNHVHSQNCDCCCNVSKSSVSKSNVSKSKSSVSRSAIESLGFGAIARSFVGVILLPATVVKTRYESGLFHYTSLSNAVTSTYSLGGFRSLYSGLWPTLLRDVPYSSFYFMFYTILKDHLVLSQSRSLSQSGHQESSLIFVCAITAGIMASSITHPFDVIKTRMQVGSVGSDLNGKSGLKNSIKSIMNENGWRGFSAGITPRIMRRSLMSGLAWTVFERAKGGSS